MNHSEKLKTLKPPQSDGTSAEKVSKAFENLESIGSSEVVVPIPDNVADPIKVLKKSTKPR